MTAWEDEQATHPQACCVWPLVEVEPGLAIVAVGG
jgi:hypothetical protein